MAMEENSGRAGKCVSKGTGQVVPVGGYEDIYF